MCVGAQRGRWCRRLVEQHFSIHEFVRNLGEGYAILLAGDGAGVVALSGQKQRLAIARAWLKNLPVLVVDEATSSLDPTSRILVFKALKHW